MKRIRILLVVGVGLIAVVVAAPQTLRELVNRVRGVSSGESEPVAAPFEEEAFGEAAGIDWAPPPLDDVDPAAAEGDAPGALETTQLYSPGSVRHNWKQAAEDNPLLADGSMARLPDLGETTELPSIPGESSNPLVESLPPIDSGQPFTPPKDDSDTDSRLLLEVLPPVNEENVGGAPEFVPATDELLDKKSDALRLEAAAELPSLAPDTAPPVPPAPQQTAPVADALDPPAESQLAGANLLLFAREMVQLQVWDDWHVSETAAGRDVRLIISSAPAKNGLSQGMWLSCHVVRGPQDPVALENLLMERVAAVTKERATLVTTRTVQIGQTSAVRADFLLETEPLVVRGTTEKRRFDGFHLLAPTPWALLEIHGVSPVEDKSGLQRLEQMLASLTLREPKPWSRNAIPATRDAQEAFGVWKSSRGRMRIFDHGRIDIEADRLLLLSSPTSRQEAERMEAKGPPRLRGTYRAEGNVIYITWNDGSRLNLRWKLSKGNLLVTDHQGQISKLKPLIE